MYSARLDIADATGFNTPNTAMGKTNNVGAVSEWAIEGAELPAGKYAIEMFAALNWNDHADRKFYNMAKAGEETRAQYPDLDTDGDYRYWAEINGTVVNPTQRKAWGGDDGLGLTQKRNNSTDNHKNITFVHEFTTATPITSVKLAHSDTLGFELMISNIRLINLDKAEIKAAQAGPVVDENTPRTITLADTGITTEGLGTTVNGGVVTINQAGSYTVSGTIAEGEIVIDEAVGNGEVELVLDGMNLTRTTTDAPIYAKHTGLLKLKKNKNTTSTITDTRNKKAAGEGEYAVTAKGNVSVVGKGTLTINGTCKSGIGAEGGISLKNGTLTITATNKALYANKYIEMGHETDKGNITLLGTGKNCVDLEITAETIEEGEKTGIILNDATYSIKGGKKGMKAAVAAGNEANAAYATININAGSGTIESLGADEDSVKAQGDLTLAGGTFTYKATATDADGLDVEGNVNITGGTHTVTCDNDGIHSDKVLSMTGGNVTVTTAREGFEALDVEIGGGNVNITATDDGINAGGGSDEELTDDAWGEGEYGEGVTPMIHIYRANEEGALPKVFIYAQGDGIDSNGDIQMDDGWLLIEQDGAGNSPIDYHAPHTYAQNGGSVFAIGSDEHLVQPDSGSCYAIAAATGPVTTAGFIGVTIGSTTYYAQPQHCTVNSVYLAGRFGNDAYTVFTAPAGTPTGADQAIAFVFPGMTYDEATKTVITTGSFSATNSKVIYQ